MSFADTIWDLGHGTHIYITQVGEFEEGANGTGMIPMDYHFAARGRLSRRAIKRKLTRMVGAMLVIEIARVSAEDGVDCSPHWSRRAQREQRWMRKNMQLLP